ncbi:putative diguanylate cyclase YeaP [bacterium HR26]|nr:putative diguanylate cyclase YeaP [bacterium HR26]
MIVTAAQPVYLSSGDPDYPIIYISPRITEVTGFTPDEFRAIPALWFRRIHPDDKPLVAAEAARTDATGEPFKVEFRFQRKDGRWVWLENNAIMLRDQGGKPLYWHGLLTDITERKRSEMLLSGQLRILERIAQQAPLSEVLEQLCRLVEEQAPDLLASVLLLDQEGRLHHGAAPSLPPDYVAAIEGLPAGPNQGSCGTAAYLREPVVVTDTAVDPRWAAYRDLAQVYGLRACWSVPVVASTGEVLATFALYAQEPRGPEEREWRLIELATQLAGLAIERWREQEQLRYQAGHDLLTGLPNRALFLDRLEHALARAARDPRRVAVLFIDLDGFKQVNDLLGHQAGDELLVQVARRLETTVRAGDTVARFAGDEFTVLLEDLQSLEDAVVVAERMIRVIEEPFVVAGRVVGVSASIGIADSHPGLTDPGALLLAADQALYAAKRAGKARYMVAM